MRRSRHGTVVAYIALFVALGGTATAAGVVQLKPNSVGSREIKDHSIRPVDLAFTLRDGAQGPAGPQGAPGEVGGTGLRGATGDAGQVTMTILSADTTLGAGDTGTATATCPNGRPYLTGGAIVRNGQVDTEQVSPSGNGVTVTARAADPATFAAYAVCTV
jgi:hypothetical protein